jgi:Coenzyme PQQ synthesis protein D (PqqD)
MTGPGVVRPADAVAQVRWRGEVFVLPLDEPAAQEPVALSGTAAYLWERVADQGGMTLDQLVERAVEDFPDADLDQIRTDIGDFVQELERAGILTVRAE